MLYLHIISTSAVDGREKSTSLLSHFIPVPITQKVGWAQNQYRSFKEQKNNLPFPGF
jgi:hypothetical protein